MKKKIFFFLSFQQHIRNQDVLKTSINKENCTIDPEEKKKKGLKIASNGVTQASLGRLSTCVQYYLLLAAGLVPLLLPPALLEPLEPEKNLVTSSETSGSSGLGLSMFMDCSISCEVKKTVGDGGLKAHGEISHSYDVLTQDKTRTRCKFDVFIQIR